MAPGVASAFPQRESLRVRIKVKPRELELDGVALDRFDAGAVRDVSPAIGSWLIAQGYAEPEMRSAVDDEMDFTDPVRRVRDVAMDRSRPRRRSTDR
jgi:hypothetical protein